MFAAIVFFASLVLIIALFTLRSIEERRGERFAARGRTLADNAALNLKDALVEGRAHMEKLPPEVAHHTMKGVVAGAHAVAAGARLIESHAHRVADFVSAKRGFERRETKSEFLKQVTDFRNDGSGAEEENV